jgi:hypothetical protein
MTPAQERWRYHHIKSGRWIIGFTYYTQGGFWRAYSYENSLGVGPFFGQWDAEAWVRGMA